MSVIIFDDGIPAQLAFSERPILLLGLFESGKVAFIEADGTLRITEDEVRFPLRYDEILAQWQEAKQTAVDTEEDGA